MPGTWRVNRSACRAFRSGLCPKTASVRVEVWRPRLVEVCARDGVVSENYKKIKLDGKENQSRVSGGQQGCKLPDGSQKRAARTRGGSRRCCQRLKCGGTRRRLAINRAHSWVQVISSTCRSVGRLLRFGKTWTGMALRLWICQMHEPRRGVQCIVFGSHAELFFFFVFFCFWPASFPSKDLEVAVGVPFGQFASARSESQVWIHRLGSRD